MNYYYHLTLKALSSVEAHGATLFKAGMEKVAVAKSMMHGLTRGLISMAQGGTFKSGFASGFTSSAFSVGTKGHGGFVGRTAIMAVVGGTASKLGGGKFSNGAVSGAFVHMFNGEFGKYIAKKGAEQAGGKAVEETAESLNVNKSMSNILKSGGQGVVGGAIAGFALAGPVGGFAGAVLGLAGGLVKGAAMEAFGVYDAIENTSDMVVNYTKEQVEATGTLSIEYKVKE